MIALLPQQIDEYDFSKPLNAKLLSSKRLTSPASADDVRELLLQVESHKFNYLAGQSIAVLVPGPHVFGHQRHIRLYTIAEAPASHPNGEPTILICVKRCSYIDEYSGEIYKGIASNYLCELQPGDQISICGPYGLAFNIPQESDSNLLLIGMGTGIAPFRAMVKHIYENLGSWQGKIRLFYGARSGLETLYMNDERDDFANYYDKKTFAAFKALSPRPNWSGDVALGDAVAQQGQEIWELLCDYRTYVYIAGLDHVRVGLEAAFVKLAGSEEKWQRRKAELVAGRRWAELIY